MCKFLKKQVVLFFLIFLILGLFFPTNLVQAQAWYVKVFTGLPNALIVLFLQLILLLANGIFFLTSELLSWVISGPFNISFTNPANNSAIAIGWTLLRDLTNMLFILGLAYIGLATALNLGGFETKKTFANILLIALIINFTPVICGVIVDVSNILSNFFLGNISFNSLVEFGETYRGGIGEAIKNLTDMSTIVKTFILIVYALLGSLILFLFTIIFFVRPIAIWILVILSPIAFFAWIFNDTRKFFKMWWGQFIQWSFIAVPAGFFIYLSQQILVRKGEFETSGGAGFLTDFTSAIAPYILVIAFMFFGFFMSLKTNAMGSEAAIKLGKKVGGLAITGGKFVGKKGALGTQRLLERKGEIPKPGEKGRAEWEKEHKIRAGLGKFGRYAFGEGTEEEKRKWGTWGKIRKGTATAVTLGAPVWARPLGRYVSGKMEEEREKEIQKTYKKVQGKTLATQEAALKNSLSLSGPLGREQRIGSLQAIAEDRNFEKIIPETEERKRIINRVLEDALKFRPETVAKTLRFLDPEVTQKVSIEMKLPQDILKKAGISFSDEDLKKGFKNLTEKLIGTIQPSKMSLWSEDVAGEVARSEAAHKFWTGAHISEGGKLFGAVFFGKFREGMQSVAGETEDKQKKFYERQNPSLHKYLGSSAAQGLGVGFGTAPKKKEGEKISKEEREGFIEGMGPGK